MFLFTSIIDVMSIFRTLLLLLSSIQRVSADSAANCCLWLPSWLNSKTLPLSSYSFPISLRVGGWASLDDGLHTKITDPRMVIHLSSNWAQHRIAFSVQTMQLPIGHFVHSFPISGPYVSECNSVENLIKQGVMYWPTSTWPTSTRLSR